VPQGRLCKPALRLPFKDCGYKFDARGDAEPIGEPVGAGLTVLIGATAALPGASVAGRSAGASRERLPVSAIGKRPFIRP